MRKAVIILHGFTGDLSDNEYLVNDLQLTKKYDVYAFTLKGHAKNIMKIEDYQEWIDDAEDKIKIIMEKYRSVYLVGHSMGGLIASEIAIKHKKIKKLVLAAPAFDYLSKKQILEDLKNFKDIKNEKEIAYNEVFRKGTTVNFKTVLEFTKLVKACEGLPEKIDLPVLILHGENDEVVPLESSKKVFARINSQKKYILSIPKGRHKIFRSDDREELANIIHTFLKGGRKWNTLLNQRK